MQLLTLLDTGAGWPDATITLLNVAQTFLLAWLAAEQKLSRDERNRRHREESQQGSENPN